MWSARKWTKRVCGIHVAMSVALMALESTVISTLLQRLPHCSLKSNSGRADAHFPIMDQANAVRSPLRRYDEIMPRPACAPDYQVACASGILEKIAVINMCVGLSSARNEVSGRLVPVPVGHRTRLCAELLVQQP